jgi:xanthine/CO dehydrogenase XdhC/CoxF family maturation factor
MTMKDSSLHLFDNHDDAEDAVRSLSTAGIKDRVIKYETTLKSNHYVVMVHGHPEEVAKARRILAKSAAWKTV